MIPIGHKPIVEHIMEIYGLFGFNEFVLCLGYKGWKIKEYFLNHRYQSADISVDLADPAAVTVHEGVPAPPWQVTLSETGMEAMTGARIARARKYVGDETFMVTYGDGIGDIDISALLKFHRSHGKLATITSVRPASRFGEMVIEDGLVVDFQEKPQTARGFINGGFFVFEKGVFDYLSTNDDCILEGEPLRYLARDRQLMTFVHEGFWMPMDTIREYELLNQLWKDGAAPWKRQGI